MFIREIIDALGDHSPGRHQGARKSTGTGEELLSASCSKVSPLNGLALDILDGDWYSRESSHHHRLVYDGGKKR
jgi:hypothetical protein